MCDCKVLIVRARLQVCKNQRSNIINIGQYRWFNNLLCDFLFHSIYVALDSSGSPDSGFVLGQNFWLGSMKGCEAVQKPHTLTLSNRFQRFMHSALLTSTAPFDIEYRMVYAEHKSPWQIQVEFMLDKMVCASVFHEPKA